LGAGIAGIKTNRHAFRYALMKESIYHFQSCRSITSSA
jgi:hypothetical protein